MKKLVLLGGGHSHVEVIRRLGMHPPRDARMILVSPDRHTAYSGMLPGFVAGHYRFEDCHIDLALLCRAAGVEFRETHACGLDPTTRSVQCADGATLGYDMLSVNIGSTSGAESIPGAPAHATCVKPVTGFTAAWERMHRTAAVSGRSPVVAVVGGGAGGVEIALAMHYRLQSVPRKSATAAFHVVTDSATLLPGYPHRARSMMEGLCRERGITVHVQSKVTRIERGLLHRAGAPPIPAEHVFLATGASAPAWIAGSGLQTDARGFVAVNDALQSPSHAEVFAAGDIASMINHAMPKSGVYAVRQGPPLATNLRRMLAGQALVAYAPQKNALALISTGDRHAIACLANFAVAGAWVWRWKDWIDRRFMATYGARLVSSE